MTAGFALGIKKKKRMGCTDAWFHLIGFVHRSQEPALNRAGAGLCSVM